MPEHDAVDHPAHYTAFPGVEVIDLTQHLNFCRGNAVKYIARAGLKDAAREVEDLQKARWYIDREIERIEAAKARATADLRERLGVAHRVIPPEPEIDPSAFMRDRT